MKPKYYNDFVTYQSTSTTAAINLQLSTQYLVRYGVGRRKAKTIVEKLAKYYQNAVYGEITKANRNRSNA